MSDIFISYKREDQPAARALAAALEQNHWTVWWDPHLRAGERFDEVIERELNDAGCVIVLWSEGSIKSQYVIDEATFALNRKKLIPVAIDEVSLPFRFQGLHTLFLTDWKGSTSAPAFQKLLVDIKSTIGLPPSKREKAESPNSDVFEQPRPKEAPREAPLEKLQPTADKEESDQPSTFGITAIYGEAFKETKVSDVYLLRVHVNLLSRASDADHRAEQEMTTFSKQKHYGSFEIINRRHNFLAGYYEYTVRFKR